MTWDAVISAFVVGFVVGLWVAEYSHYKLEQIYRGKK